MSFLLLLLHLEMLYPTEAIQAHGRKYKGIVYCMFLLTLCPKRLAVNKSPLMGDRSFFPKPLLCNYIWKMSSFVLGPECFIQDQLILISLVFLSLSYPGYRTKRTIWPNGMHLFPHNYSPLSTFTDTA